jgi:hypothetical protein
MHSSLDEHLYEINYNLLYRNNMYIIKFVEENTDFFSQQ